ncbi:MAG TPA: response regulator transcription factor [Gaiellaceae bacterium]|nr:response regulator transcription factor [Gaiellaceae bacterium]
MKLLVIEDEPRILSFLRTGLEAEGFAVDAAGDGVTGLALALAEPYQLVVLDLQLPRLDGLRLLSQLHAERPTLPIVILSARADLPTRLRGFELGCIDFVPKPFSFEELLARIRVHLHGHSAETPLQVGSLELDLGRRKVRTNGLVADLSDREFRLLLHLVSHPGEVVSRERLLSEVWGYSFDPTSNVVDVCVRRLRKKLGSPSPIETVRHAGYRLVA